MSPIKSTISYFVQAAVVVSLFSCSDLRDPLPTRVPEELNVHPSDWLNVLSSGFHGQSIREDQWNWDACKSCHGDNFEGGISEVACTTCHRNIPHPLNWLDRNSDRFHGIAIREAGWQMQDCQSCHGVDYAGATTNVSCLTCHPATPEDCITCHGGTDNITGAPPEDLDGNVSVTAHAVGAHTVHLSGADFSAGVPCETCHLVPSTLYAAGHLDGDDHAEVIFSGLAGVDGALPVWEESAASCADSYCHGNWSLSRAESNFAFVYAQDEIAGSNSTPHWNDPTSAACGTCHGLPPTGHNPFPVSACVNCHGAVVDGSGAIIDKTKHVNGLVNVFGQEFPFPSGNPLN